MFHELPTAVLQRMQVLEQMDQRDRRDGTDRLQRLRQIPPETGRFLALLAANVPEGAWLEIGTSAGYSALWLSCAARERKVRLKTYEVLPDKIRMAKETFTSAGIENQVELIEGDFLQKYGPAEKIAFCFLDAEKEVYEACFDIVADRLVPGGLLVADNAINHYTTVKPMIEKAMQDTRFDCVTVPIGNGEFLCRRKA